MLESRPRRQCTALREKEVDSYHEEDFDQRVHRYNRTGPSYYVPGENGRWEEVYGWQYSDIRYKPLYISDVMSRCGYRPGTTSYSAAITKPRASGSGKTTMTPFIITGNASHSYDIKWSQPRGGAKTAPWHKLMLSNSTGRIGK